MYIIIYSIIKYNIIIILLYFRSSIEEGRVTLEVGKVDGISVREALEGFRVTHPRMPVHRPASTTIILLLIISK